MGRGRNGQLKACLLVGLATALALTACSSDRTPPRAQATTTTAPAAPSGCAPVRTPTPPGQLRVTEACTARVAGTPPATPDYSDVVFADARHGWASGQSCVPGQSLPDCGGLIEATVDGGTSWATQYRGALAISHLDFLDDSHGFAVGDQPGCVPTKTAACIDTVLATTDGGTDWGPVYTTGWDIRDLHFTDPRTGWAALRGCPENPAPGTPTTACPGRIVATTDGGGHWSDATSTPGPVVALSSAGSTGWAVEAAPTSSQAPGSVEILRTSPSGTGWQVIASVPAGYDFDSQTAGAINFSDAAHGWLSVFEPGTCAMHGCGVAGLWQTSDGGRTWTAADPPTRSGCGGFGVTFALAPGGAVYATQSVNLATCDPPATTLFARLPTGQWADVHGWAQSRVAAMAWLNKADGWAATGQAVVHSTDGGATWAQSLPAPTPTRAIAAAADGTLWAAGTVSDPGAVLSSHDDGATWATTGTLPGSVTGLSAADGRLWATEWSSPDAWAVYGSSDGAHWTRLYRLPEGAPTQTSPTALDMFGDTGVLVTTNGSSMDQPGGMAPASYQRTADGGRTWTDTTSVPDPGMIMAADFTDASYGWILSSSTTSPGTTSLLATSDSARTWATIGRLPADMARSVSWAGVELLNHTTGWVWGYVPPATKGGPGTHLVLLAADNGGSSWRRYDLPVDIGGAPGQQSAAVLFGGGGRGWVATPTGFWRTTDGGSSWSPA